MLCGRVNFTNLSRYSPLSERTYRRQFEQDFAFVQLNQHTIAAAIAKPEEAIGAIDCSFIAKSGKATYGVDWFYNGSANRSEKGLEISVIAVVDVAAHQGYTLSVQQTPPSPVTSRRKGTRKTTPGRTQQRVTTEAIQHAQAYLQQLPDKGQPADGSTPLPSPSPKLTRIDHYLHHLGATRPYFPEGLRYLVGDGFYSKQKFIDGVVALDLEWIGKLRLDADLRYLYTGPQKKRGCPRKYDGKVTLNDISRFTWVEDIEPQLSLYTALVWHVSLKRTLRLALLVDTRKASKTGMVLLFSTDTNLHAKQIFTYYKARFQIEFIFRDAKQFTGLSAAQTRHPKRLDFHFNASLSALNLAKYDAQTRHPQDNADPVPFSMASYKRMAFNDHLLECFIRQLELDPTSIKSHPNYQNLRSHGIIAA
ncbi:transposase [Egbenema bharatensis]|uniref:transposase n=1 Tax=Egbenema bharatensis TaxID=3463334 RepID=UPI003A86EAC5